MSNETIATETTEAVGELPIDELLSDGITNTPPSFVRAILAAASDPAVTSFAGGLPNPISFPQEALLESHLVSRIRAFEIDGTRGGRTRPERLPVFLDRRHR